eukprot:1189534-Prorocentrum_minimum.AAC.6
MATWLSDFPARLPSARAARAFPSASPVRSSCSSGFRSRCGDRACTRWQPGCHSLQTLLQDCSVPTLPESSPLRRRPQQCAVAAPQVISPGAGSPFSVAAAGAAVSTRDEQNMHSFIRRSLQLARAGYVQCVHNKKCNCLQDRKCVHNKATKNANVYRIQKYLFITGGDVGGRYGHPWVRRQGGGCGPLSKELGIQPTKCDYHIILALELFA